MTGNDIKLKRINLGFPRAAVAELDGVASNTVWRCEAELRIPKLVVLKAVQSILAEVPFNDSAEARSWSLCATQED